jgi:signal peptidase II
VPGLQEEAGTALSDRNTPSPVAVPTGHRRAVRALLLIIAVVTLAADQLTKVLALGHLTPGRPVDLVGSSLRLNLIRNPGAAFSLGDKSTWLLTVIAVAVLIAIATMARRLSSRAWAAALGLILGGALGNLADRFFRAPGPGRGQVVDFIDYFGWFIGNVADIAIVGAAAFIAVLSLRGIPASGSPAGRHTQQATEHTA